MAVSFVAGGCLVSILSLLAEKANEKVSGIIMMFPSTSILGFFFLGITTSANKVADVIPATLIPLGVVILSSFIYIHFAILLSKSAAGKFIQVTLSFVFSSICWFLLAAPFAVWKLGNIWIGTAGFLLLIVFAYYLLNKKRDTVFPARRVYTKLQVLFRAIFMGTIIAAIVFLGKTLGPFWGGIFTMYPAATFSALIIFHFYYQPVQLFHFFRQAPLGSLSLYVYALAVMQFFPIMGVVWGTVTAVAVCLLVSVTLINLQLINKNK
jgi:hypothetical protein